MASERGGPNWTDGWPGAFTTKVGCMRGGEVFGIGTDLLN